MKHVAACAAAGVCLPHNATEPSTSPEEGSPGGSTYQPVRDARRLWAEKINPQLSLTTTDLQPEENHA